MKYLFNLLLFTIIITGCSTMDHQNTLIIKEKKVLLTKNFLDTIFQKEQLLKRYLKFNQNDTIYIQADSSLGINKNWNRLCHDGKFSIVVIDTTDKHFFKFLKLKVRNHKLEIEAISESTGNMIIGKARLNHDVWDLNEINAGLR